jgi:hypothetical protein
MVTILEIKVQIFSYITTLCCELLLIGVNECATVALIHADVRAVVRAHTADLVHMAAGEATKINDNK